MEWNKNTKRNRDEESYGSWHTEMEKEQARSLSSWKKKTEFGNHTETSSVFVDPKFIMNRHEVIASKAYVIFNYIQKQGILISSSTTAIVLGGS